MSLTVRVQARWGDVSRTQWDGLVDRIPHPTIFHTYDWHDCWMQTFGTQTPVRLITIHQQDDLIGLIPLMITPQSLRGVFTRRLLTLLTARSPASAQYLSPICLPASQTQIIEAALPHILSIDGVDALHFENMRQAGPLDRLIGALEKQTRRTANRWVGEDTFIMPLAGSPDAYKQSLTKKKRKNLVAARNRFKKTPDASIERLTTPSALDEAIEAFRLQSIGRLEEKGAESTLADETMHAFFSNLVHRFDSPARGYHFAMIVEGRIVGTLFALRFKDYCCYYNGSFDMDFGRLSPGTLLVDALILAATDDGLPAIDMLAGHGDYKHRWSGESSRLHYATIPRKPLRCLPFTLAERYKSQHPPAHEGASDGDNE